MIKLNVGGSKETTGTAQEDNQLREAGDQLESAESKQEINWKQLGGPREQQEPTRTQNSSSPENLESNLSRST